MRLDYDRAMPLQDRFFDAAERHMAALRREAGPEIEAAGDVLWLVSNSGKEPFPVALALGAKERGCAVVAVTCVAFSRSVPARHSSGKRVFEVAGRVIDTRGPLGDAAVTVPGLSTPIA